MKLNFFLNTLSLFELVCSFICVFLPSLFERPTHFNTNGEKCDRLCGLVVRVLGYRSGGPGLTPGTTKEKVMGLERGPLSLVSTTEELLDRKVAAPV
jgi:hypothetical protein